MKACLNPIGVVGLGFLGRGITASLLIAGFDVVAVDAEPGAITSALRMIEEELHGNEEPVSSTERTSDWRRRLRLSESTSALHECGFLIESITEDAASKSLLFDELELIVGPDVTIATNTSAIPIASLQNNRRNPARFLGIHWAELASLTRFLEIIRGPQTGQAAVDDAMSIAIAARKEPCLIQHDIPGFIANRLGYALYREALHLLDLGVADVDTIDRSFRNSIGLWAMLCGPFRWIDITGGAPLYAKAMQEVLPTLSNNSDIPESLKEKASHGRSDPAGCFYPSDEATKNQWLTLLHDHARIVRRIQEELNAQVANFEALRDSIGGDQNAQRKKPAVD